MPGDGLDLRSSLTKFSDSSLLLNHVLTTLVNEVAALTERIEALEADNLRQQRAVAETKVDESLQVEDLPEAPVVQSVQDLNHNTPAELAQINANIVRMQAELAAHKLDIDEAIDKQRGWVLEQIADAVKLADAGVRETGSHRQMITFVGSGQRDTAGRMASLETKMVSQEYRLKAMEHALEAARRASRISGLRDGTYEEKDDDHPRSSVLGRLDALEHQSAELSDSLSKLPSHDDWEQYRTMMTSQWKEMEERLFEESKHAESNSASLTSSIVEIRKELDRLKQDQLSLQQQALFLPPFNEDDYRHPMAQLHLRWAQSGRELEAGLKELRETETHNSKLAMEMDRLMARVQSSIKDLQDLLGTFVPQEDDTAHPLQVVMAKLETKNDWSWVVDQRCERVLDKLDAVSEQAQELLRFEAVDPDSDTMLSDLGNAESVRTTLSEAIAETMLALGRRVNVAKIAKQVRLVEYKVEAKLDKQGIHETLAELKSRLSACAEMEEIEKLLIKKASVAELQDVRQTLQRQIELIARQPSPENFQKLPAHEVATDAAIRSSSAPAYSSGTQLLDQNKMYDKIEALGRFVIQAQEKLLLLVPRPELEAALRAIIDELSAVKARAITNDTLDTMLQQKADKVDVQRLVTVVAKSIDDLQVPFTPAAATKQRCIACDRRTVAFDVSVFSDEDEHTQQKERPVTAPVSQVQPRSPSPPQQRQENLPPLVADGIFSAYNRFIPATVSLPQHMSERVRSSAGGGVKVSTASRSMNLRF